MTKLRERVPHKTYTQNLHTPKETVKWRYKYLHWFHARNKNSAEYRVSCPILPNNTFEIKKKKASTIKNTVKTLPFSSVVSRKQLSSRRSKWRLCNTEISGTRKKWCRATQCRNHYDNNTTTTPLEKPTYQHLYTTSHTLNCHQHL